MTAFVIVTYKISFTNQVIEYFKNLNPMNGYQFCFISVGLDEDDEKKLIESVNTKLNNIKNLNTVVIFSDVGLPNKFAKRIRVKNKEVEIIRSKGSLIENGFATYMVLNTKAPKKVVSEFIEKPIRKI